VSAVCEFTVTGTPVTQGSKTGFVVKTASGHRAIVADQNAKKLKPWREAVRQDAITAMAGRDPFTGPVTVTVRFALARPSSAPKTRRTWPTGARSGDVDKLLRAILDALTDAGVFADDAQVVRAEAIKDYAGYGLNDRLTTPGAAITVHAPEHTHQERLNA
jgi:Holliday junction resolvase RusA-like endonuclease